MFANCSLAGMDFGFPDVCLTPSPLGPVPVPYPNLAQLPMALPPTTSLRHLISMMPAHNLATLIPTSQGDTAGVQGGVLSGIMMGPARNTLGSTKVFTGGSPATRWMSPALQNQNNCPGGCTLVPSQYKVMIMA